MTLPCFGDQKGEQSILLMTRRTGDCLGSLSATLLGLFFFFCVEKYTFTQNFDYTAVELRDLTTQVRTRFVRTDETQGEKDGAT